MRELDETDLEILRLLVEDARRPYREIADAVDLSPPSVSDRIDRLREEGVIRGFTLDLDRSMLRAGVPVLVDLRVPPGDLDDVSGAIRGADAVEHVFTTADARIVFSGRVVAGDVRALLDEVVGLDGVDAYDVSLLTDVAWTPQVGGVAFALSCDECGNTVTSEGVSTRVGGEIHHFCCPSCRANYVERYDRLEAGA